MKNIRTRFAPSPTGFLHVGGLRTALYNYLLSKKYNGSFLLRIEDTDQTRKVEGAVENIIKTLSWAGLTYDEGPHKPGICTTYIQSERLPLYTKFAKQLVDEGHAYYCFCSTERLETVREAQKAAHLPPAYDRHCRNLPKEEAAKRVAANENHVIRMKAPIDGEISFNDLIRGDIVIQYKVIDDQVIIKSDGFPTYHLAVVVDDHDMQITHVIRGEEWLPSTPKHLLLYKYFGWEPPKFAHLPLLLNPDRSKLSKRQGDVAVEDYQRKGYLPEALVNFIALLGWNPGDTREIFTLEELIQEFSMERIGKAGAIFNIEKLNWINKHYIVNSSADYLLSHVKPLLITQEWYKPHSDEFIKKVITIMQDRAVVIPDFIALTSFFFTAPTSFDEKVLTKCWSEETIKNLQIIINLYEQLPTFDAASVEHAIRNYAQENNMSAGKLILPLRLVITGVNQGPDIFQIIELIGKEETFARIRHACETVKI